MNPLVEEWVCKAAADFQTAGREARVRRLWCEAGGVQDEQTTSKLAQQPFSRTRYQANEERLAVAEE